MKSKCFVRGGCVLYKACQSGDRLVCYCGLYSKLPFHPAAEIFPMLGEEDLNLLASDIKLRGQLQPILTYQGRILDGRNRLAACLRVGIVPKFQKVDAVLRSRTISPVEFVVAVNVRRRQLRPGQQALAAAAALPEWVAESRRMSNANLLSGRGASDRAKVRPRGRSDEQLARLFGISARYIRLAAELRREAPDLAEKVMQGTCTLNRAIRAMRAERTKRAEAAIQKGNVIVDLIRGDARHVHGFLDRHYDLILTDPPYYARDLGLWDALANMGSLLKPGGFLAAISGTQFMDEVIARLSRSGSPLRYFWTVALLFRGAHPRRHRLKIINTWRPILLFYKPPFRPPTHAIIDQISITAPPVASHPMELPSEAFQPLIKSFTSSGDWILDPFAGSGSSLQAARMLGRNSTGCEKNFKYLRAIEQRLAVTARRVLRRGLRTS